MTPPGTASTTRRPVVIATALAAAAAALLVVVGAGPASAHASLVSSSPADQSSLTLAPKTVTLTFDESIRTPAVIVVRDAYGASFVQGKTSVVDNIVSSRVRFSPSGDYVVVYRVVSADGHPVSGRLTFGVGSGNSGGTLRSADQVAAGGHQHDASTGASNAVIGMIASLALMTGVALLTIRRWAPNLWSKS